MAKLCLCRCIKKVVFHSQVLAELKEYATEVDVDFVRKAVRAIGRCAIKVEVRCFHAIKCPLTP